MAAAGGFGGGGGGAMCPHCSYLLPNHADWCPMATPQRSSNERRPETPSTSPRYSGYSPEDLEEMRTPLVPPPIHRRRASWMNSRPDPRVFEESRGSAASSESAWERMPPRPRAIRIGRPAPTGRAGRTLSLTSAAAESAPSSAPSSPPSSPPRSNKRKGNKTPRRSPKRRRKRGGKRHSRKKRTRRRRTKRRRHSRKKRSKKRRR